MVEATTHPADAEALSYRPTPANFGLTPEDVSRAHWLTSSYSVPDWLFNAVAWPSGVTTFFYFISAREQPFVAALMLAAVSGVVVAWCVSLLVLFLGTAISALRRRITAREKDDDLLSRYERYQTAHSTYRLRLETRLLESQVARQREHSQQLRQAEEDRRRADDGARIEAVRGKHPDRETYAAYRKTDHWHKARAAALARAGSRCQVCSCKTHLQVHHNTYKNLGEEKPEDLVVLCDSCHETFHDLKGTLVR